jgi:hypothetical protein
MAITFPLPFQVRQDVHLTYCVLHQLQVSAVSGNQNNRNALTTAKYPTRKNGIGPTKTNMERDATIGEYLHNFKIRSSRSATGFIIIIIIITIIITITII